MRRDTVTNSKPRGIIQFTPLDNLLNKRAYIKKSISYGVNQFGEVKIKTIPCNLRKLQFIQCNNN